MGVPYSDRVEAGRLLAEELSDYRGEPDLLVLALPRGGVPVAREVARALGAELDVLVVRKLGLPGQPELAMGAIASGGICLPNLEVLRLARVGDADFRRVEERERRELERRERAYRGERPAPRIEGRTVLLVDDGLATGSTMRAAVAAVRQRDPERVVVAVPVAPPDTVEDLRREADEVVCPETPFDFAAVGQFYRDFTQVEDEEVREALGGPA